MRRIASFCWRYFALKDPQRNSTKPDPIGSWLDDRRLTRGVEEPVPERAEIGVAEVLKLRFEVKR